MIYADGVKVGRTSERRLEINHVRRIIIDDDDIGNGDFVGGGISALDFNKAQSPARLGRFNVVAAFHRQDVYSSGFPNHRRVVSHGRNSFYLCREVPAPYRPRNLFHC